MPVRLEPRDRLIVRPQVEVGPAVPWSRRPTAQQVLSERAQRRAPPRAARGRAPGSSAPSLSAYGSRTPPDAGDPRHPAPSGLQRRRRCLRTSSAQRGGSGQTCAAPAPTRGPASACRRSPAPLGSTRTAPSGCRAPSAAQRPRSSPPRIGGQPVKRLISAHDVGVAHSTMDCTLSWSTDTPAFERRAPELALGALGVELSTADDLEHLRDVEQVLLQLRRVHQTIVHMHQRAPAQRTRCPRIPTVDWGEGRPGPVVGGRTPRRGLSPNRRPL